MYTITIGKNKNAAVEVHLDTRNPRQPNPSAIPPAVGLGVGDKKKRYKAYLEKCFNGNPRLLNYLAYLHRLGKEKGTMTLIAQHKLSKIHTEGIKEFLEENRETLDAILPYVFPGEGYKAPEGEAAAAVQGQLPEGFTPMPTGSGDLSKLSADDMQQIKKLIEEDQAKHQAQEPDVDVQEAEVATVEEVKTEGSSS